MVIIMIFSKKNLNRIFLLKSDFFDNEILSKVQKQYNCYKVVILDTQDLYSIKGC